MKKDLTQNIFISPQGDVNVSEELRAQVFDIDLECIEIQIAEQPQLHAQLGLAYAHLERKITLDKINQDNQVSDLKLKMESYKASQIERMKQAVDAGTGKKMYTEKMIEASLKSDPTIANYMKEINLLASSQIDDEYRLTALRYLLKASEQRHASLITLGGLQRSEREAE